MPNVDQRPHCGEEINENDIEEARLYREFERLCNQDALKKRKRIKRFLRSPLLFIVFFFLILWTNSYPWLLIEVLVFAIVMLWAPMAMDKKDRALFEQYKKDFDYPPRIP